MNRNKYRERDMIIWGREWEWDPNDIKSFGGLTAEQAQKLLDGGHAEGGDSQNSAPSFADILSFLKENPSFTGHGYAVSPGRSDYRVTIEGVEANGATDDELVAFDAMFKDADEYEASHKYCRAWYN